MERKAVCISASSPLFCSGDSTNSPKAFSDLSLDFLEPFQEMYKCYLLYLLIFPTTAWFWPLPYLSVFSSSNFKGDWAKSLPCM